MNNKNMNRDARLNKYLAELCKNSSAVAKLYPQDKVLSGVGDSLNEDYFEVVPGLVHKFQPSVLWLLNGVCAAQCSFCERLPKGVGDVSASSNLRLSKDDHLKALEYIQGHPEIADVIFSGGDPLTQMLVLPDLAAGLAKIDHVKTVRIHTKYPLQNPRGLRGRQFGQLQMVYDVLRGGRCNAVFLVER